MNENENKITTPEGKDLVLIEKFSAAARNHLRRVMLKSMDVSIKEDVKPDARPGDAPIYRPEMKGFHFDVLAEEKEAAQIKVAVKSYGDLTDPETILKALLDASPEEYDFVVAETDKVLSNVNFS